MTMVEFADTVSNLPADMQNEFFANLPECLTDDEKLAVIKYCSLFGLFKSPAKYKALRSAIASELFGCEIPYTAPTTFGY